VIVPGIGKPRFTRRKRIRVPGQAFAQARNPEPQTQMDW